MSAKRIRIRRRESQEVEVESYRVGDQVFHVGDYVRVIGVSRFYRIVLFRGEGRYAILTEVPNRGVETRKETVALSLLLLLDSEDVVAEIDIAEQRVSELQDILDYIWAVERKRGRASDISEEREEYVSEIDEDDPGEVYPVC